MLHSSMLFSRKIEEESLSRFNALRYYPVHIGEQIHNRYTPAAKLGYGGYSTVWLCHDTLESSYKTLKVGTLRKENDKSPNEIMVSKYLKSKSLDHNGRYCVRRTCDYFEIEAPNGYHPCFVYEPLGNSLLEYVELQPEKVVNLPQVKWITTYLLHALDYLHQSGVVHTDVKLNNVLCTLPENGNEILQGLVDNESQNPSPRKVVDDGYTIYESKKLSYDNPLGFPILCDLGMGVYGKEKYTGVVQPIPYRAPEVILRMRWDSSIDIWNLGVLVWELLCGEFLFGHDNERDTLSTMISYLGPPPERFIDVSPVRSTYFDDRGSWNGFVIESIPLKERLEGTGDIDLFLDFLMSTLDWEPGRRKSAAQLLHHPWLSPDS
ncbi:kinase-like protein [Xylona heveae TC161]|uniref:Kinase-like protein n=1 Tax=Xylona heveae (strain CBS 132557 / TC161) TaxID=1328760 RepID=A0A164Z981_XYLHT|nr:kinase-like protein [Xylona heveae TC161]KZF18837.1 kinase-like protein [Xylona heveae TC161]